MVVATALLSVALADALGEEEVGIAISNTMMLLIFFSCEFV